MNLERTDERRGGTVGVGTGWENPGCDPGVDSGDWHCRRAQA
ncbi:hypothetical protein ACTXG7_11520 [Mycolicibacterium sp. Dal123E01]